jgi:hypothetical protein
MRRGPASGACTCKVSKLAEQSLGRPDLPVNGPITALIAQSNDRRTAPSKETPLAGVGDARHFYSPLPGHNRNLRIYDEQVDGAGDFRVSFPRSTPPLASVFCEQPIMADLPRRRF